MKLTLGDKYYTYNENEELIVDRLYAIKDDHLVITRGIKKLKVPLDHFESNYVRLEPDCYLLFTIVYMDNDKKSKDVCVGVIRKLDLDSGSKIPYAMCRQQIFDSYAAAINRTDKIYIGMSMSLDTVPDDTPYQLILACHGVEQSLQIAAYVDDNIYNLLGMVPNMSDFDKVLSDYYNLLKDDKRFEGQVQSVYSLLKLNEFEYDYFRAFNIIKVKFRVRYQKGFYALDKSQIQFLEGLVKHEILQTYLVKYDHTIDLSKIERSYVLISDKNKILYVLAYDKGERINREYSLLKDKRDAVALLKLRMKNKK